MARSGGSEGILTTKQCVVNTTDCGFLPSMLFRNYKPLKEAENREGDLVKVMPRAEEPTTLKLLGTFRPSQFLGLRIVGRTDTSKDR